LQEVVSAAADATTLTQQKLDEIHAFVNSDMTVEKRAHLVSLRAQLVLINRGMFDPPTPDEKATVTAIENQIDILAKEVAERDKQQEIVDRKLAP
jgi:hypothetical protein